MTSEELANEIMAAVVAVQGRILTVGAQQYEEEHGQKFELMSLQEIVQAAIEEVEDGIAYNVMLRYKLTNLRAVLESSFGGYAANKAQREATAPGPAPVLVPATGPVLAFDPRRTYSPANFAVAAPGYAVPADRSVQEILGGR